ncbi:MarR family winged helix-turn-helix transcriptional regulator [Deinococcus terrestris]|nr:MarR family transcriptional regulator [Deinococcus terrestris]
MAQDAALPSSADHLLTDTVQDLYWTLRRLADHATSAVPLPLSEVEVLRHLHQYPGVSVSEIARDLGLQHSNVSATLRSLSARDLIVRRPDERDRRCTRLYPSPTALATRAEIDGAWARALAPFLEELSGEDRDALLGTRPLWKRLAALRPALTKPAAPLLEERRA